MAGTALSTTTFTEQWRPAKTEDLQDVISVDLNNSVSRLQSGPGPLLVLLETPLVAPGLQPGHLLPVQTEGGHQTDLHSLRPHRLQEVNDEIPS